MSEQIVTSAPDPNEYFPAREAGIIIGGPTKPIRPETLAVWRVRRRRDNKTGPAFVKILGAVRYRRADLEEFLASCRSEGPKPQPPKRKYTRRKR
jgi:hypothetical protein